MRHLSFQYRQGKCRHILTQGPFPFAGLVPVWMVEQIDCGGVSNGSWLPAWLQPPTSSSSPPPQRCCRVLVGLRQAWHAACGESGRSVAQQQVGCWSPCGMAGAFPVHSHSTTADSRRTPLRVSPMQPFHRRSSTFCLLQAGAPLVHGDRMLSWAVVWNKGEL